MVTFWGKVIIFWGNVITFGGPLSLLVDLCTLCQIHQKSWQGSDPPPPSWQCQDFESCCYSHPSLSQIEGGQEGTSLQKHRRYASRRTRLVQKSFDRICYGSKKFGPKLLRKLKKNYESWKQIKRIKEEKLWSWGQTEKIEKKTEKIEGKLRKLRKNWES